MILIMSNINRVYYMKALEAVSAQKDALIVLGKSGYEAVKDHKASQFLTNQQNFTPLNPLILALSLLSLNQLLEAFQGIQKYGAMERNKENPDWWLNEDKFNSLTLKDFWEGTKVKPLQTAALFACVGAVVGAAISIAFGMPLIAIGLVALTLIVGMINVNSLNNPLKEYDDLKKGVIDNVDNLGEILSKIEYTAHLTPETKKKFTDKIIQIQQFKETILNDEGKKDNTLEKRLEDFRNLNTNCMSITKKFNESLENILTPPHLKKALTSIIKQASENEKGIKNFNQQSLLLSR